MTLRRMDVEKENKSCKWRDDFTWICFNGDSEMCAGVARDDYCKKCKLFEETTMSNVDHPTHYTNREHECIDEMIAIFGKRDVIAFCKCNAWKYRYRADSKGKHDEDMQKADWYISKAMELQKNTSNDWRF